MTASVCLFWFRRDLRLDDNHGLYQALLSNKNVLPLFIFDTFILEKIEDKNDKRVNFLYDTLLVLKSKLEKKGSSLLIKCGTPVAVFNQILNEYNVTHVYANHDYEPYALKRDQEVQQLLESKNIVFRSFKDQVIYEKSEIVKDNQTPYTVFTPYSRKWKLKFLTEGINEFKTENHFHNLLACKALPMLSLKDIGFKKCKYELTTFLLDSNKVKEYEQNRNFPAVNGTMHSSVHLRFGTISVRQLVKFAAAHSQVWLNELIWREFYMMILFHHPHVANSAFKKKYDAIPWLNNESDFKKWCSGNTGYPIVDAGMRQLNETGWMHNRVRMITASFLVKHLLIDWRWGEHYFASKLMDFDLAANNGGWQWSASSGCDAAPYFRIFNPHEQTKRFDPKLEYIKKWVPEFQSENYPMPIVDHAFARVRAIKTYKATLTS